MSLRMHAVEEVYELVDAIEAGDDVEMGEELGDLLLQVVFHAQLATERGAFDFDRLTQVLVDKLVRRHPHVFGDVRVKDVDQVWANWEAIKKAEKAGSKHERRSALDGIPRHLPALMRAQKLVKKASKAALPMPGTVPEAKGKGAAAAALFDWVRACQERGWNAEELLRAETARREKALRAAEKRASAGKTPAK